MLSEAATYCYRFVLPCEGMITLADMMTRLGPEAVSLVLAEGLAKLASLRGWRVALCGGEPG